MKRKSILHLFSLLFYPCIVLSAGSDFIPRIDAELISSRFFNETNQKLTTRNVITDIRKTIAHKIFKNRTQNLLNNKSGYKVSDNCSSSSTGEGCIAPNSLSVGTTSSYIEEYSVFAVVGTGIRLPEEQIESFNGIDD